MLKRYIVLAFRNLRRQRLFTFINIAGLAISMAVCLMVLVSLHETFSYDNFHPHAGRIFRVTTKVETTDGRKYHMASTPLPLGEAINAGYKDVEQVTSVYSALIDDAAANGKEIPVRAAFTNEAFFRIFGFKLKWGNANTIFADPNSIVVSDNLAQRYFGAGNPVGKVIRFSKYGNYTISGVLETPPSHSHLDFDAYASLAAVPVLEQSKALPQMLQSWDQVQGAYTYVLMKEGKGSKAINDLLAVESHRYDIMKKEKRGSLSFASQPLNKITPSQELYDDITSSPPWGKVLTEALVALGLLICACFNYINLTIVRSLQRAKEVGIQKVNGAQRWQIFLQFIIESVILCFLSFILAITMLSIARPDLRIWNAEILLLFLVFSFVTGVVAGIIPAWSLSSFQPVKVLKNMVDIKLFGGIGLRKTLIVIQFTLSIASIFFLITVARQFSYKAVVDMGFARKDILDVPLEKTNYELIKQRMLGLKDVEACTATSGVLGMPRETRFCRIRTRENKEGIEFGYYATDNDFIKTMHLTLVAGTNFPAANTDQERYIVINERAAGALGYKTPGEAIGQNVWLNDSTQVSIIGVLKNFNYQPIEVDIRPMALRFLPQEFTKLQLKMAKGDKPAQVAAVQDIWQSFNPGKEWKAEWMDESLAARNGREVVSMLSFLVFICTLIAALGLLGIVSYTSFIRRKEISVRKVLGADVISLLVLLSQNYLKLIFIAALIAMPIGILGSSFFLRIFAYRVSLGILPMALGFLGLFVLALITILSQTWATVQVNPAKNLRND